MRAGVAAALASRSGNEAVKQEQAEATSVAVAPGRQRVPAMKKAPRNVKKAKKVKRYR